MNLKNNTQKIQISQILQKSISDFFSAKFLTLSILPIMIVFAIVFGVYYLTDFDLATLLAVDGTTHPWLNWILSFSFVQSFINFFLYLFIWGLLIVISVVLSIIVVGFFTPKIVKEIQKKHYPHIKLTNQNFTLANSIFMYLKIFFIFFTLLIITLPLSFIPGVNLAVLYIPFYYLFHNFLVLDVGSSIVSKEEFFKIVKNNKALFRSTTLTLYLISLIPLSGILLQVFFVIVLSHEFFIKKEEFTHHQG